MNKSAKDSKTYLESVPSIKLWYLLRDVNGPDHSRPQHPLPPHHQLLEEVYRDIIVRGKEDANVTREEIVDLVLATILSSKLFRRDLSGLNPDFTNLMHILVMLFHCKLISSFYSNI